MKKTNLGLFVILFAMVATVCTSCKKEEPVEEPKFDLTKVNFVAPENTWIITHFYCEDVPSTNNISNDIDYALSHNELGLKFESDGQNILFIGGLTSGTKKTIWGSYSAWDNSKKELEIEATTKTFLGKVTLTMDTQKVYFEYIGKDNKKILKDFLMKGYMLKEDFK